MPGPDDDRLIELALEVLEETKARCRDEPQPRTRSLRLALAYLASRGSGESWPYDSFWRAVAKERPKDRWQLANGALNAIYRSLGRKRDLALVGRIELELGES